MSRSCVFTIVSKNYISYARVLLKSFHTYHPEVKAFVLLADKINGYFDPHKEPFEVIEVEYLDIKNFDSFSFKYNIIEFNTAVKPFCFEYLFNKFGFEKIVYLDPDILIFNSITEIFDLLGNYSIVLIPHITKPLPEDGFSPKEIDILRAGIFNLGFLALGRSENTEKFLYWWKERLYDKCLQAPLSGYAIDQIWVSLVPCFFEDYYILRKPGYNVAYWNLHEYFLKKKNGNPLRFFHFSGFDINNIDKISKYQNRYRLKDVPELKELLDLYFKLLMDNGFKESKNWPYYYGFFSNGKKIPNIVKSIYWGLGSNAHLFGNPYNNFYKNLFNFGNFRAIFSERFIRAIFNNFFLSIWKISIKRNKQ